MRALEARGDQRFVSNRVFGRIIRQYKAWQTGIVPTRDAKGWGAQNPRLLLAFEHLEAGERRARPPR